MSNTNALRAPLVLALSDVDPEAIEFANAERREVISLIESRISARNDHAEKVVIVPPLHVFQRVANDARRQFRAPRIDLFFGLVTSGIGFPFTFLVINSIRSLLSKVPNSSQYPDHAVGMTIGVYVMVGAIFFMFGILGLTVLWGHYKAVRFGASKAVRSAIGGLARQVLVLGKDAYVYDSRAVDQVKAFDCNSVFEAGYRDGQFVMTSRAGDIIASLAHISMDDLKLVNDHIEAVPAKE